MNPKNMEEKMRYRRETYKVENKLTIRKIFKETKYFTEKTNKKRKLLVRSIKEKKRQKEQINNIRRRGKEAAIEQRLNVMPIHLKTQTNAKKKKMLENITHQN